jgi:hypothetical protein
MILGFTGTRRGLTPSQRSSLKALIETIRPTVFHHGDCVGADAEAHDIVKARYPDCEMVLHPPQNPALRAFKKGTLKATKPYLDRNRCIVDSCELLVACPGEITEATRSGTWSTIRYAKKQGVQIHLLYPSHGE